ncbi:SAM-dependent methyltransferase [Streptomyces triticirhizae]|uniref:SAM-dependent methyltransferase n=1 Tax=Streptomyces triticirhizae TaxID=2483353 RepID=A0A3M2LPS8_9ACTN|nr:SAM-dependent methyltransferase [Streptomyces triticirhizae]RMI39332.1 SAM-dependent methyltransferase [Streptomyces triticirhizae]
MLEEQIDPNKPDPARVYDWFLGGKTSYPADEQAGQFVANIWPGVKTAARANRAFIHRAVRWLAGEAGIRQFLDIGTGIPTEPNLHQTAQGVAPDARIVYTDNRLIVLRYAEALMTGTAEGRTAYLHADFFDPPSILDSPRLTEVLDLDRPIALCLNALLHYIADDAENGVPAHELVAEYVRALPSGSYVVITHVTSDFDPPTWERIANVDRAATGQMGQIRNEAEIRRFFDGLELVEPGLVPPQDWRPDGPVPPEATHATVSMWAGVARVP